jgi:hypothetical protein
MTAPVIPNTGPNIVAHLAGDELFEFNAGSQNPKLITAANIAAYIGTVDQGPTGNTGATGATGPTGPAARPRVPRARLDPRARQVQRARRASRDQPATPER